MANYAITRYDTGLKNSIDEALEDIETQLETVDDTKSIHLVDVQLTGRDRQQCVGFVLYNT